MDKYEKKIKLEEINNLIKEGDYEAALDIADTVDWATVKNISTLGKISDLYKMMHRFEECRDILLIAYGKQNSKAIVKSLCEVSIELNDPINAIEYCKEFVQLAPRDPSRYILKYKIYKAQNVSLEEQIEVLETLNQLEYKPKWAYELATLYHRVGMESKCVEECDKIKLWCVDGKYVLKAFELKAQHQQLSEKEVYQYELLRQAGGELDITCSLKEKEQQPVEKKELEISGPDAGPVNTQSLQAVVAAGLEGMFDTKTDIYSEPAPKAPQTYEEAVAMDAAILKASEPEKNLDTDLLVTQVITPVIPEEAIGRELEKAPDELEENAQGRSDTDIIGNAEKDMATSLLNRNVGQPVGYVAFNSDTSEEEDVTGEITADIPEYVLNQDTDEIKPITGEMPVVPVYTPEAQNKEPKEELSKTPDPNSYWAPNSPDTPIPAVSESFSEEKFLSSSDTAVIESFHKSSAMDSMLSQGYDGQISLVVPEYSAPEKQITGQISIDDVMREWEMRKKAAEDKRLAELRDNVRKSADSIFADYDDASKELLLKHFEDVVVDAAVKQGLPKQIKVSDIGKTPETKSPTPKAEPKPEPKAPAVEDTEDEGIEEIEEIREDFEEEEIAVKAPDVAEENIKEASDTEADEALEETLEEISKEDAAEEEEAPEEEASEEEETSEEDNIDDEDEDTSDDEDEISEEDSEDEVLEDEDDEYEEEDEDPSEEEEENPLKRKTSHGRNLTSAERKHFEAFLRNRSIEKQLVEVLDNITLASYTGNVMVSFEDNTEAITFSKLLIKEIQLSDDNFTGRVAQIKGSSLNRKEMPKVLEMVKNGAMIITEPQELKKKTVEAMVREMEKDGSGIVIIIQGSPDVVDKLLERNEGLARVFNLRIDLKAFDNKTLVEYAKTYAYENEYAIDDLAALALHKRIDVMQTADHEVTFREIEEILDDAIYYANRKTPKHFFDILIGKRYDKEDMIVLREKDFTHY